MNKGQERLLESVPALGLLIYTNESGKHVVCGNESEISFGTWSDKVWYAPRYTQDWQELCPLSSVQVFMRSHDKPSRR